MTSGPVAVGAAVASDHLAQTAPAPWRTHSDELSGGRAPPKGFEPSSNLNPPAGSPEYPPGTVRMNIHLNPRRRGVGHYRRSEL